MKVRTRDLTPHYLYHVLAIMHNVKESRSLGSWDNYKSSNILHQPLHFIFSTCIAFAELMILMIKNSIFWRNV